MKARIYLRKFRSSDYFRFCQPPSCTVLGRRRYCFELSDLGIIWFASGIEILSVTEPEL